MARAKPGQGKGDPVAILRRVLRESNGEKFEMVVRNMMRMALMDEPGSEQIALAAGKFLVEHGVGKPKEQVDVTHNQGIQLMPGPDAMTMLGIRTMKVMELQDDGSYAETEIRALDAHEG